MSDKYRSLNSINLVRNEMMFAGKYEVRVMLNEKDIGSQEFYRN